MVTRAASGPRQAASTARERETVGHFEQMLNERGIPLAWAEQALTCPDLTEDHGDGTRHFLKRIPEHGNRWLRVIVNVQAVPAKPVTVFFDRRVRKQYEDRGR